MSPINRYPIILAHFDFLTQYFLHNLNLFGLNLSNETDNLHYFKGIATHLRDHGFDVYHTRVRFAANVEQRSSDLRAEINKVLDLKAQEKVHIIAHSMGGLDARHMIVDLGMAERVARLTTIGTPHNETSFADWGIKNIYLQIAQAL